MASNSPGVWPAGSPQGPGRVGASVLALLAALVLAATLAAPAAATVTPISTGTVSWGVKQSWRAYAGPGTVADGAAINPDGTYSFPVVSGSYDDQTQTTTLQLAGSVHWQSYPDYPVPGHFGLDTTFKDLSLEIGPGAQVVRGTNVGYSREDPGGELHAEVDVVLAKLDAAAATTSFVGGNSEWSAVPAVAGAGLALYPEGTPIDSVDISYQGPGGVPDLGEHWDQPGQVVLSPEGRWVSANAPLGQTQEARQIFAGGTAGPVQIAEIYRAGTTAGQLTLAAHDPVTLAQVGTPLTITYPQKQGQYFKFGFDRASGSIYYVTGRDGAGGDETTVRRASWNPVGQSYDTEVVGHLAPATTNVVGSVVWNPVREELGVVATSTTSAGFNQIADLYTFKRVDGAWQLDQDPLAVQETGPLAAGLTKKLPATLFTTASPLVGSALAVARDGSYVQAPAETRATVSGEVKVPMPALRIQPDWAGTATVTPLWATQLPEEPETTYFSWGAATAAADGSVLLHNAGSRPASYVRVDVDSGGVVAVGPIADAPQGPLVSGNWFGRSVAADPVRGWDWATDPGDPDGFTVDTLVGEEIVSRFRYPDLTPVTAGYPALGVGDDGALYLPVLDQPSGHYGYQRLGLEGVLAELVEQPADSAVTLGVGEESEEVSFSSSAAGGDPAPTRQWQVKAPGASGFADLAGEVGPTLTVAASPGMGGSEYRAVYSSRAGAIASDPARLDVSYAPRLLSEPPSRSVTAGTDATFLVGVEGAPEPTVSWQRRVSGFWQSIAGDDENFAINGPSLTVLGTNTEQSGTLFRAKVSNAAGSVLSRAAKLTVSARTTIPAGGLDLTDVTLLWSGNAEMQKQPPAGGSNYFSAGVSSGSEASYRAVEGDAAVYQVSAGGDESLATWATRSAHVANGGRQLVRLFGGEARIEPDGSATVDWQGSWSVNFYGGLVPFTFKDPELAVGSDGSGTLTATMSGCESSQANPSQCTPFAPVGDVTVATFSGVEIDPAGEVTITPDYAGVEIAPPIPFAAQWRSGAGWGAWPQAFVDFQAKTGLAPYWYTSNSGFDPDKPPAPFVVDFRGAQPPSAPPPEAPSTGTTGTEAPRQSPAQEQAATTAPGAAASTRALVVAVKRPALLGAGPARVATLSCPAAGACAVRAPRRVGLRIADRRYPLLVLAPRRIAAGHRAALRLRLPRLTRAALAERGRRAGVRLRIRAGGQAFEARLRFRGLGAGRVRLLRARVRQVAVGADPAGAGSAGSAPRSEPISAESSRLARPVTAADVSDVRITWYPRDSWLRYAASGIAPGDGIAIGDGASGRNSTASACPDRPSSSDAQLPYAIDFAPLASWYDPVSGTAAIYGQGSVGFRWKAHTIDLRAADPEIEINGAAARVIFRVQGSEGTPYPNQRADLLSLDTAGRPTVSGRTYTYNLMRGTLTANGVNVFAGFYTPPDNDEFGCVSVSFTTP